MACASVMGAYFSSQQSCKRCGVIACNVARCRLPFYGYSCLAVIACKHK